MTAIPCGENNSVEQNGDEPRITVSYPHISCMAKMSLAVKLNEGVSAFSLAMIGLV